MPIMKVLLADDHPIVLMGVREIIERDPRFEVVGEALNSSELIRNILKLQPDVIITDYNMPGDERYGDGTRLIDYVRRKFPNIRVLILSIFSNSQALTSLYKLGVSGIISKTAGLEKVLLALDAIFREVCYQQDTYEESAAHEMDSILKKISHLNIKEFDVLRLFASGMTVSEVGHSLNRSIKTVSTLKNSAMRKLDVDNDHALIILCVKANLIA